MRIFLILPHQLFSSLMDSSFKGLMVLAEDPLFFRDEKYPTLFHKQKLVLHRASMKNYEKELKFYGYQTLYVEAKDLKEGQKGYEKLFSQQNVTDLYLYDPEDFIIEKRLRQVTKNLNIKMELWDSPNFLSTRAWIKNDFDHLEHYSFTSFYIRQRKRLNILINPLGKPEGGQWTYDQQNRKKAPKGLHDLKLPPLVYTECLEEAIEYVEKNFSDHVGTIENFNYPVDRKDAQRRFEDFLENRLALFGPYQDAILKDEWLLMHSLLSPSLNIGLLTPHDVLETTLKFCENHHVPLNSLEGFLRQVIGWREFIRGVYRVAHIHQRKTNFWSHYRKIPQSFYEGTTGIIPIDVTIQKLLKHAYCHHIERLMVLGSFMLLCEFDPDAVYRWFMEMFIDSYDWVMVPNVYGMSQFADGGMMTTKPYICGSNYIRKMSNYPSGDWCQIWDGLFWRFLYKHQTFFKTQARLNVLCHQLEKMEKGKLEAHLQVAEKFLKQL